MNTIQKLQTWFRSQCDGTWEHQFGVKITSCDNPGWWIKIDLHGTNIEGKPFHKISKGDFTNNIPQPPWINCYIENGVFNGSGDIMQLGEILDIFLAWAQ